MIGCWDNLTKPKRYIQFNDLVFLGRKSIDEQSESISLRESKTSRTFTNGSYVANRGEKSLIDNNTISLKVALRTSTWSEAQVQAHYEFIIEQLMTPGKLWAIQTGLQLVYCNAYVTSIQPKNEWVVTDDEYLVFSVEFDNPDGVWYKADENMIYLEDYNNCDFLCMKASCLGKNRFCCNMPMKCPQVCECCDDRCGETEGMIGLCEMKADIDFFNDFFEECNSKWRVVVNCEKGKREGKGLNDFYPHVICDGCVNDVFTGEFLSETVLDSNKWSLALMGHFKDPEIRLNDSVIKVSGEYSGVLTIDHTGDVRFAKSWECIEYDYQEVSLTKVTFCMPLAKVVKGRNTISVAGATGVACIYIDYERLTL